MNEKQLLEVIASLKSEILDLLLNTNMNNDRAAKRTLSIINNTFTRLGLEVEDVIPKEVLTTYFGGVDEATKALQAAGVNPLGGLGASITASGRVGSTFNTHVHLNAIAEITDATMLDFKAAIRTAQQNTYFTLKTTLAEVKNDLKKGIIQGNPRKVVTQRVAESFVKDGMTSFITVDGKKLPLDFYSQVVTRTNLKKANTDGALSRYKENGIQYVTVSGGYPTCHDCNQYRGFVFSLIDDNSGFPYLPPNTFPLHPNCNCSLQPYAIGYKSEKEIEDAKKKASKFEPGKDTRSESQKRAYKDRQDQLRKRNAEKKQYADYKAVLGDDAPKSLGGFRRSKTSQSDNFVKMQQDYRDAVKSMKGG